MSSILCEIQRILLATVYNVAGNFRGIQFSWMGNLQIFRGLIFADGHSRTAPPTIPVWLHLLPHTHRGLTPKNL